MGPAPGSARAGGGSGAGLPGGLPAGLDFNNLGDSELQNLLNNMSQQQLMQLFGGSLGGGNASGLASLLGGAGGPRVRQAAREPPLEGLAAQMQQAAGAGSRSRTGTEGSAGTGSAPTVPVPAPAPGGAGQSATPIQLSDLQSILSNIQVPPGGEAIGAGGSGGPSVDLSTAMTGEALQPILSQEGFLDKVKAFLPAGEEEGKEVTAADLKGTVQSPQFQQAVSMFSMALQSGQIAPLVREFGLGDEAVAAATQGDMGAFVKALQKDKASGDGDGKDAPEDMALD